MLTPRTLISALVLAFSLTAAPLSPVFSWLNSSAWAQDDDDSDGGDSDDDRDDDDGDDDDNSYSSTLSSNDDDDDDVGEPVFRQTLTQRPAAPLSPPPVNLPRQAPDQIVIESLDADAADQLVDQGFAILRSYGERTLLRVPAELSVPDALQLAGDVLPDILAAPNSFYRSQAVPDDCQGDICTHWQAVNWPPPGAACLFEPHIGIVDTGVNLQHDMLLNARVNLQTIGSLDTEPSERKHGTAIVAMFVGDEGGRVPGLAPSAALSVVDPFGRVGSDERSDVFALAEALDRLHAADVAVVSLSLAGPDNPVLAAAIERLHDKGIPVVAAVGNDGPRAEPLYPAAYDQVIAVTAVDAAGGVYRRAVQGEHVSFAAPGVDIATAASVSGVRPQTGTSFAVPFVTTAIAAALASGTPASEVVELLAQTSVDLGEAGQDPVFGWGLVQLPSPC